MKRNATTATTCAALLAVLTLAGCMGAGTDPESPEPAPTQPETGAVPTGFEQNAGQAPDGVDFILRTASSTVYIDATGWTTMPHDEGVANFSRALRVVHQGQGGPVGVAEPLHTLTYALSEPRVQAQGIPVYERIEQDVGDGMRLAFYTTPDGLPEFDLLTEPGVEPSDLEFHVDAAMDMKDSGALFFPDSGIEFAAPIAYQGDRDVPATFLVENDSFRLSAPTRDPTEPLVIDPVIVAASGVVGSGQLDWSTDVEYVGTDTYVLGYQRPTSTLGNGIYVQKFDFTGTLVIQAFYSSPGNDQAFGIHHDPVGNRLMVAGATDATSFLTFPATPCGVPGLGLDMILLEIEPATLASTFVRFMGGEGDDYATSVTSNPHIPAVHYYVSGFTDSVTGMPVVAPAPQPANGGGTDGFLAGMEGTCGSANFGTYIGGPAEDRLMDIDLQPTRDWAAATGFTYSSSVPLSPLLTYGPRGGADALTVNFYPWGSGSAAILNIIIAGGTGDDFTYGISFDPTDMERQYVAGKTTSTDFPVSAQFGSAQPTPGGGEDILAVHYDGRFGTFLQSTYYGGGNTDGAYDVAVSDATGRAHVTGWTASDPGASPPFPTTTGSLAHGGGAYQAHVVVFDPGLVSTLSATYLGGNINDVARGIKVPTGTDESVVAGTTWSGTFPTTGSSMPGASGDSFMAHLVH